jgi:hypothetical protein
MVTRVPLSEENVALVRQHVPESVLTQLGDWQSQIPLFGPIKLHVDFCDNAKLTRTVSSALDNKLFFTNGFYCTRLDQTQQMTITQGVALTFFESSIFTFGDGRTMDVGILHACGFENGAPFGHYRGGQGRRYAVIGDYCDRYSQGPEKWTSRFWDPQRSPDEIIDKHIPELLELAIKSGARVFPRIPPEPVQQLLLNRAMPEVQQPLAEPAVQPAPAEVRLPPVPAVETSRAWYQVIGDALSSCIASLVDCFLRFFETLRVRG